MTSNAGENTRLGDSKSDFRLNVLGSGDFVGVIEPTTKGTDIVPWATANFSRLKDKLTKYGALVLRGFKGDTHTFSQVADLFSTDSCKLQGQISPRTQIHGSVFTSTNFPAQYPIGQHHENCYDIYPPAYIFFYCNRPAESGGETALVDARSFFKQLDGKIAEKFQRLGVEYHRNFTPSSPYKTGQQTFLSQSKEELEKYCESHGIKGQWVNGRLRATQVRGATTRHPVTGDLAFFNVAHIWHWSSIEKAALAFGGDVAERIKSVPPDERWGNAHYGDGSEIETSVVDEISGIYRENETLIPWEKDDVVIVDNVLCTHGRRPFTGPRELHVTVRKPSKNPYVVNSAQATELWKDSL